MVDHEVAFEETVERAGLMSILSVTILGFSFHAIAGVVNGVGMSYRAQTTGSRSDRSDGASVAHN